MLKRQSNFIVQQSIVIEMHISLSIQPIHAAQKETHQWNSQKHPHISKYIKRRLRLEVKLRLQASFGTYLLD